MNTEAMNTLKKVREAINATQIELMDQTLTPDETELLADALVKMNKLEDIIINSILQEMVDKINSTNDGLKQLIVEMKASTEKIAKFSNTIKKISEVVGVLAEITAKAISAGII